MVDILPTPEDDTDVPSSNVSDGGRECDMEGEVEAEREREEVEKAVYDELMRRDKTPNRQANGHVVAVNGNGISIHSQQHHKVDWEIPRKLLHSSIGFFTLYLYISESDVSKITFVLWSSLCIIVPADILRFRWPAFARLYERMLGFLMRESERHSTNGVIWYILGVNFALQFYPRDVATLAILILSWADTAASTIGRLFGSSSPRLPPNIPGLKIPLAPRKSWAGFIAASVTGAVITVGFWSSFAPMRFSGRELSWSHDSGVRLAAGSGMLKGWLGLGVIGVFAGLVSGVAEALDLGSLDDNLTLPVISGGCILGFLKLVGWIGSFWASSSS